jgi:3'-phosphoadenosine 5'-phosphosulfate sulfotransferase (PAPS reductase)/FAD synthetase
LEFPEIREFVKTVDNVEWIRPKMPFRQVIEKYGYPVVSKVVSMGLHRYRVTTSEVQRQLRLHGGINPSSGKKQKRSVPVKYHYLKDAPFKISEKCCDVMKKEPFRRYEKETDRKPYIGTMAEDSFLRRQAYLASGCNAFSNKKPQSTPMMFWREDDVWRYIRERKLPYASVYDKGEDRTGCMFCMFGCQRETGENRFQRMARTHPKQWAFCMDTLGLRGVLEYMGLPTGG